MDRGQMKIKINYIPNIFLNIELYKIYVQNMTDNKDEENTEEEPVDSIEENTESNNTRFSDVQLAGGVILAILLFTGGFMLFGGGMDTTSADGFDYPEWADENGFTINDETGEPDVQLAIQSHTERLSETSFTLDIEGTSGVPDSDETQQSSLNYQYNPESQTAVGTQNFNGEVTETFDEFANQQQFSAQNVGTDEVTYDRQALIQPTPFTGANEFIEILSILDVEATDVVNDGNEVVYTINGVNEEIVGEVPVTASGEFRLHTDGYFTYMDVEIHNTQDDITTTQEIEISDVGSTEVVEPDWVDTAREETDELEEEDFEIDEPEQPPQEGDIEGEEDEPIVIE